MDIRLTPDQEDLIRRAIETGRLSSSEDAAREAMALWETRERRRTEILAAIDEAEADIARGAARNITRESMRDLAEDVKRRGRERFAGAKAADGASRIR
jgi:Arc/MetJ-type ribon-helix-helix transcriptional regulator